MQEQSFHYKKGIAVQQREISNRAVYNQNQSGGWCAMPFTRKKSIIE